MNSLNKIDNFHFYSLGYAVLIWIKTKLLYLNNIRSKFESSMSLFMAFMLHGRNCSHLPHLPTGKFFYAWESDLPSGELCNNCFTKFWIDIFNTKTSLKNINQ